MIIMKTALLPWGLVVVSAGLALHLVVSCTSERATGPIQPVSGLGKSSSSIWIVSRLPTIPLEPLPMQFLHAGTAGGALRARRIQTLSVTDSELSGNTALGTVAPAVVGWSFSGSGGAVYASGGVHDLSLLRSNVSHNRGVSGAGGFLFQGAENAVETGAASLPAGSIDPSPGVHWLESSAVVGNEAGLGGGAMWYSRLPLQVVVTGGSRLEGNVAHGGSGGALWAGWVSGRACVRSTREGENHAASVCGCAYMCVRVRGASIHACFCHDAHVLA